MLSPRPSRLRLLPRLVFFAGLVYGFFWISGFPRQYDDDELPPGAQQLKAGSSLEPYRVDHDKLVVSVKTTAPDALSKLPSLLLLTSGRDHDGLLLMGDLQMDIGPFHVHDVLDRYNPDFVAANEGLARYQRQREYAQNSVEFSKVKEQDPEKEKKSLARLDKYKVLRMLERTWEFRPERSWYVFVDPETYLVRENLLSFLGQYDPEEPIFFANTPLPDLTEPFALGGTLFILSVQAMRALFEDREDLFSTWDSRIADYSSAFEVLSAVLSTEVSLTPTTTWPGITGFNPSTVPYGPGLWCEQVLAMHSVPVDIVSDVWRLERERQEFQHLKDPLLYADLWIRFMQPENLDTPRQNWNNLASGPEFGRWNILFESAHATSHRHRHRDEEGRAESGEESWEACQESCNKNDHCVQWSYSSIPSPNFNENGDTKCHLSRSMRFGAHIDPQEVEVSGEKRWQDWVSGWRKEKFTSWARQQRCKGQQN